MAAVDEIYDELQEKHKGKDSPEQLRAWSHLLEMGKCNSCEDQPDKPFFKGRKSAGTVAKKPVSAGMSPVKRVNMRSELIDQLQKWHQLLELGAISHTQYN